MNKIQSLQVKIEPEYVTPTRMFYSVKVLCLNKRDWTTIQLYNIKSRCGSILDNTSTVINTIVLNRFSYSGFFLNGIFTKQGIEMISELSNKQKSSFEF